MSENIKPSEVSEVLLQQLKGIDTHLQFDEVGNVLQVSDGVARIYGLRNAEANELLEFENGIMAIVMNLEEDNVGAVLLGPTDQIKEGMVVKRTKRIASINVGEGMLGRVIDPLGVPLDGRGQIGGELCEMPLERKAPGVIFRQPVNQPLQTGLKSVDAMIPIGRGQRELIIGDRQTGKTSIAIDTILNQKSNYEAGKPVYCIYVAIGQKGSTVASLVNTLRERGAMDYTIVVAATAADPAALQYFAPFAGAAIGEYFRDTGRDALVVSNDFVTSAVNVNFHNGISTWCYFDEFHILLRDALTASYFVAVWKMLRKKGCVPSALTQNVKDLLASREIEAILDNTDFMILLAQAQSDRAILAKQLGISEHQLSYITHSNSGEGLLFYGDVTIPFVDRFPKGEIYNLLTTRPEDLKNEAKTE